MPKRYCFWRTPAGKPYKGNDGKHAPTEILAEMGRSASPTQDGTTFTDLRYLSLKETLPLALVILDPDGDELNETDSDSVISTAIYSMIRQTGGKKPIRPPDFLAEVDARAAAHFRLPSTRYLLRTSLSVKTLPAKRLRICDCTLVDHSEHTKRFPLPPSLSRHLEDTPMTHHAAVYKPIYLETHGRSMHEATDRALSELALIRGLWTLFCTYGKWSMTLGNKSRIPLGMIHNGPFHTLHNLDKKPAADLYWYDREPIEHGKIFSLSTEGWGSLERHRRQALRRIQSLPYRNDIIALIIQYVRALDQPNLDTAFLNMWSLLERVTSTVGGNYDETVRRAIWAHGDRALAREILQTMRLHRNRLVHAAQSRGTEDHIAYVVKGFIDPHLLRLLRNDFKAESIEDYGEHLALPNTVADLKRDYARLKRALRLVQKWDKQP